MRLIKIILPIFSLFIMSVEAAPIQTVLLSNGHVELAVAPSIGARVVQFNLVKKDNFIKVGELFNQGITSTIDPAAENVPYLGHVNWIGPQSEWWSKQLLNSERAKQKAVWPPDPYLVLAKNYIVEQSRHKIHLQGLASPVSGVQLNSQYELDPKQLNKVNLTTTMINTSEVSQSWDIWFNTRVHGDTLVMIPVNSSLDIRDAPFEQPEYKGVPIQIENEVAIIDSSVFLEGKHSNHTKLFIDPSAGWLAGFNKGQLFIIRFELVDKNLIHPEQSQIEFYTHCKKGDVANGLIEMEFHSPLHKLAVAESVSTKANWYLFEYPLSFTTAEKLDFLKSKLAQL